MADAQPAGRLEKPNTPAAVSEDTWNRAVAEAKEEEWMDTAEELRQKARPNRTTLSY